ncbi:hypothetical protein, partial [Escherichia coli]|uniref:hypothetical protein n=1 Tax=Escherichia coli TaxID=562 RepID=UPI001BE43106
LLQNLTASKSCCMIDFSIIKGKVAYEQCSAVHWNLFNLLCLHVRLHLGDGGDVNKAHFKVNELPYMAIYECMRSPNE